MSNVDVEKLWEKELERRKHLTTQVLYDEPVIRFQINGRIEATRQLSELRRVFDVDAGAEFLGNDIRFDVLDFGDSLWIVPEGIPLDTHAAWADYLRDIGGFFQASIYWPPKAWLGGGFLGLGRHPVAKIVAGNALPVENETWKTEGPLDPNNYKPVTPPVG